MFPDETYEPLQQPPVIHSADGHSCYNDDSHWTVNCPLCEKEFEYTGYFDSSEINYCRCGCKFRTKRVYFEDDSYME